MVICIPDLTQVRVRIVIDARALLPIMDANRPSSPSTEATTAFEHDLTELLLSAFGCGAAIENTWTIPAPVSSAPDWKVTIEKIPPEDRGYEPTFLEE